MQIDINKQQKCIKVSQPGFVEDILKAHPPARSAASPAMDYLFNQSTKGEPVNSTNFASRLMKMSYLAKRTRPDLCLAVSYLATRMKDPDQYDNLKLDRLYEYLSGTKSLALILKPKDLQLRAWVDASYNVHSDSKSHTGIIIGLGESDCSIYWKSTKQKLTVDSSTFAELVALHDGTHQVQHFSNLLQDLLGKKPPVPVIYQDNKSTIRLAERGPGVVSKSKHFPVRYFYVKDCIDSGELTVEHLGTNLMPSDNLTKPTQGNRFRQHRDFTQGRE
jgi:hypothetical protein